MTKTERELIAKALLNAADALDACGNMAMEPECEDPMDPMGAPEEEDQALSPEGGCPCGTTGEGCSESCGCGTDCVCAQTGCPCGDGAQEDLGLVYDDDDAYGGLFDDESRYGGTMDDESTYGGLTDNDIIHLRASKTSKGWVAHAQVPSLDGFVVTSSGPSEADALRNASLLVSAYLDELEDSGSSGKVSAAKRITPSMRKKMAQRAKKNAGKGKKVYHSVGKISKGRKGGWKATAVFSRQGIKGKDGKPRKFTQQIRLGGKSKPSLKVQGGKLMVHAKGRDGRAITYQYGSAKSKADGRKKAIATEQNRKAGAKQGQRTKGTRQFLAKAREAKEASAAAEEATNNIPKGGGYGGNRSPFEDKEDPGSHAQKAYLAHKKAELAHHKAAKHAAGTLWDKHSDAHRAAAAEHEKARNLIGDNIADDVLDSLLKKAEEDHGVKASIVEADVEDFKQKVKDQVAAFDHDGDYDDPEPVRTQHRISKLIRNLSDKTGVSKEEAQTALEEVMQGVKDANVRKGVEMAHEAHGGGKKKESSEPAPKEDKKLSPDQYKKEHGKCPPGFKTNDKGKCEKEEAVKGSTDSGTVPSPKEIFDRYLADNAKDRKGHKYVFAGEHDGEAPDHFRLAECVFGDFSLDDQDEEVSAQVHEACESAEALWEKQQ